MPDDLGDTDGCFSEWNMEWKDRLVAQYPNGHLRAWARGVKE